MFCLVFISNSIFRQTRRHEANILRLGAILGPPHASSCIMHHASSSSLSGKLLSLCGDEMGSWIAGFAPEGGTQHDAEITLRVGDASVGRTQFSIGKLSKFQTKMTQNHPRINEKYRPGATWGRLGGVLGPSWPSWSRAGPSWGLPGSSWGFLGTVLEPS